MLRAFEGMALLISTITIHAQALGTPKPAGLENDWDIATVLQEISAHAARLLPALDRINAQSWIEKGASETYAAQLQSSKDQAKALADGAKLLAKNPERLSPALELFFRM